MKEENDDGMKLVDEDVAEEEKKWKKIKIMG